MAKVLNIVTRQEETDFPYDAVSATEVMAYILEYKAKNRSSMSFGEHCLMRDIIKLVENNSNINVDALINGRNVK